MSREQSAESRVTAGQFLDRAEELADMLPRDIGMVDICKPEIDQTGSNSAVPAHDDDKVWQKNDIYQHEPVRQADREMNNTLQKCYEQDKEFSLAIDKWSMQELHQELDTKVIMSKALLRTMKTVDKVIEESAFLDVDLSMEEPCWLEQPRWLGDPDPAEQRFLEWQNRIREQLGSDEEALIESYRIADLNERYVFCDGKDFEVLTPEQTGEVLRSVSSRSKLIKIAASRAIRTLLGAEDYYQDPVNRRRTTRHVAEIYTKKARNSRGVTGLTEQGKRGVNNDTKNKHI